jgi:hypothetical protein
MFASQKLDTAGTKQYAIDRLYDFSMLQKATANELFIPSTPSKCTNRPLDGNARKRVPSNAERRVSCSQHP